MPPQKHFYGCDGSSWVYVEGMYRDCGKENENDHDFFCNCSTAECCVELSHDQCIWLHGCRIYNTGFLYRKGQHWHNSKWELFIVVAGHGLIQERNINTGETVEFEVSGDKIEAVHMIPGWTHNIINLSETENLVTVMTCNEIFNPNHPDTFFEPV